ncbi:sporulation-specific Sps2p [Drechslerella dactyloides]|uniref:Sporulation-specific Sps2p n=1 Tax=Drechslerella dactyloides TaxID=74499 RepID=A0AAD6IS92_DREDA|nr:sporulation-specific Sps2p [Drechslerella dactyloides]
MALPDFFKSILLLIPLTSGLVFGLPESVENACNAPSSTYYITATTDIAPVATCQVLNTDLNFLDLAVTDLNGLETVIGDIDVEINGNFSEGLLKVESETLRNITGRLNIGVVGSDRVPGVTASVSLKNLEYVGGLRIDSIGSGARLDFGGNVTVNGTIRLVDIGTLDMKLPVKQALRGVTVSDNAFMEFESSLQLVQASIVVEDNTGLQGVLLPELQLAGGVLIRRNPKLETVEIQTRHIYQVEIYENGRTTSANFSNLETVGVVSQLEPFGVRRLSLTDPGIILRDIVALELSALKDVNGSFTLRESFFPVLSLPSLESVNGTFQVSTNLALTNVSLPELTTVGGLNFAGNEYLTALQLNALRRVEGSLVFDGPFANINLIQLEYIGGNFTLSGIPSFDCSWFDENILPKTTGTYQCVGNHTRPANAVGPGTSTNTLAPEMEQSGDKGLGVGAKAAIGAGSAIVLASEGGLPELGASGDAKGYPKELTGDSREVPAEMSGERDPAELGDARNKSNQPPAELP